MFRIKGALLAWEIDVEIENCTEIFPVQKPKQIEFTMKSREASHLLKYKQLTFDILLDK